MSRARAVVDAAVVDVAVGIGTVVVGVHSSDAASRPWLEEVFGPWFRPGAADTGWRIAFRGDRPACEELRARGLRSGPGRLCCVQDTLLQILPAVSDGPDEVVLADQQRSCFLRVGRGAVEIVFEPGTSRARMHLVWLACQIAAEQLAPTHLDLHASAIEVRGRAVLIAGPKESGKTTLVLQSLASGLGRFVANDRVFLGPGADGWRAFGTPSPLRIRDPGLGDLPPMPGGRPALERPYLHSLAEALASARGSAAPGHGEPARDLVLTPAQVLGWLGGAVRTDAPVGAVLFPEVRRDVEGVRAERVAPGEVEERLWRNRFGARLGEDREPTVFERFSGRRRPAPRSLAGKAAAAIPAYRVVLGRDCHRAPGLLAGLLDTVAGD